MAKITIEGTADQIAGAILGEQPPSPRKMALEASKRRQEEITSRRKIVRSAFDLIRHDPNEADAVDRLAGTLGGRYPMNQEALDLAGRIIQERLGR